MKKTFLLTLVTLFCLYFSGNVYSQITGIKTIPGDYPTIAAAIASLNGMGVGPGGATFNIAAGYTENITATLSLNASGTAANPLTFRKSGIGANPQIIAYTGGTATPSSAIQDGIWQLVGCDYVTIDGIDLYDPNTTNPASMEYGYGMFKVSATNGCQHNTIKNCLISLSSSNSYASNAPALEGSRAINVMNTFANSQYTAVTVTSAAGTNSYNRFYKNTLKYCNYGIAIVGYAASTPFTNGDQGNDIGGNADSTGNTIINFGGDSAATTISAGVRVNNQWGINISHNTFNSNDGSIPYCQHNIYGIYTEGGTSASATISFNNLTVHGGPGGHSHNINGIHNNMGSTAASNTINITNNTVTGNLGSYFSFYGIDNIASAATVNINNNTISGLSAVGNGTIYCLFSSANNPIINCFNNVISDIAVSGNILSSEVSIVGIRNTDGLSTGVFNCTNNSITNINSYGISSIMGIYLFNSYVSNIVGNICDNFSVISASSFEQSIYGYYSNTGCFTENLKNNIFSHFSHTGYANITGIKIGSAPGNKTLRNNQMFSYSTGFGGDLYGVDMRYGANDSVNNNIVYNLYAAPGANGSACGINLSGSNSSNQVNNNEIHDISYASGDVYGLLVVGSYDNNVYNNKIYNLFAKSNGTITLRGISISNMNYSSVYKNKICNLSSLSSSGHADGIYIAGNNNVYNNIIGSIYMPNANLSIALCGINLSSGANNIYYNTVYLNANSSGALFGSTAIYANTASVTYLINNIIVNTSVPKGAGLTTAYRRSSTALTTYGNTSNNNFYYAGNPGPSNLIYYDGTIAAQSFYLYQGTVAPRDSASKTSTAIPNFLSLNPSDITYLHLNGAIPSLLESGGKIISGYNDDIDGNIRSGSPGYPAQINGGGNAPDMGADEMDGLKGTSTDFPVPGNTVIIGNTACMGQTVTIAVQNSCTCNGITYQWKSSPNGVAYNDINGATLSTYTFTYSSPFYYKCIVTCPNGPNSAESTPFQVITPTITGVTGGSRCGIGSVTLSANSSPDALIKWYSSATGGTSLGSGSSFTTPSISATTTYYAEASNEVPPPNYYLLGTGKSSTNGNSFSPFSCSAEGAHVQYLVLASELTALGLIAGNINTLGFSVQSNSCSNLHNFTVKMAATANTDLPHAFVTPTGGFTTVYSNPSYYASPGLNYFNFSTSFNWNGTSNVLIDVCHDNDVNNSCSTCTDANSAAVYYSSTNSFICTFGTYANNVQNCGNTTSNPGYYIERPNMVFGSVINASSCASPRIPVIAAIITGPALSVTADQSVCNNSVATLTVSSPIGNYDSYLWTPISNLYTDLACTTPYVSGSSTNTVYFKTIIQGSYSFSCNAHNTVSACDNVASSTVTILPSAVLISSAPIVSCTNYSQLMSASPATGYGTATFQWQNSGNCITFNDITGANALNYTTPSNVSTPYYKFLVKSNSTVCIVSNVDTIVVVPQIFSTVDGFSCGPGSVNLEAYGSAGTTINWYTSAVTGNSVQSGNNYFTPIISTTTTYYAVAEVSPSTHAEILGTGTLTTNASGNTPYSVSYEGAREQYLIKAAELNALGIYAGNITSIGFNVSSAGWDDLWDFTIKMAHTPNTALTGAYGTITGNYTTVYSPGYLSDPTTGWNSYDFSTPFLWDGVSNILIDICHDNDTYNGCYHCYGSNSSVYYTATSFNSCFGSYADNVQNCGTTTANTLASTYYTRRPNMKLGHHCASVRTPVVAHINFASTNAQFTTNVVGINVNFTNTSTNGANYYWSFGDGDTSTLANPSHSYATEGTFNVMLISTNGCNSDTVYHDVIIVFTGISENSLKNITIHPNPASKILYIDGIVNTAVAEVRDISGKLILSKPLKANQIDISTMAKGLYFIKLTTEDGSVVRKFIKE